MVCLAIGNVHKRKFVSFTFLGPFLSPVVLVCQAKYYHVCFIITLAYGRRVHRRWYIDLHTFHGRNPAPVDTVGSLSHYLQGFHTSQVVQDFFHQQDQSSSLYFHVFVRMRVIFYTRYILFIYLCGNKGCVVTDSNRPQITMTNNMDILTCRISKQLFSNIMGT